MHKMAVVGIGNLLLGDDGVGIHVLEKLREQKCWDDIELVDGGTSVIDLLDVFMRNETIIIIDSLKGGYLPGTIYRITAEELGSHLTLQSSLHDVQILDVLKWANLQGCSPKISIIGIEPETIDYSLDLSATLKHQMPKIMEIVVSEISANLVS